MQDCPEPQGRSARRPAAPSREQSPDKRARATRISNDCGCIRCPEHDHPRRDPNLLSLPDEAISLIFSHLKASDTSSFYGPRNAFALAQTNTRLLRIFGTHLTRIVTDIDWWSVTTSPGHTLSVIRVAGLSLRELHLSLARCANILLLLPELCPRVERILLRDGHSYYGTLRCELAHLGALPLKSLSIVAPSEKTLRSLPKIPQEVRLTEIRCEIYLACKELLRCPPKKLHLHFKDHWLFYQDTRFQEYLYGFCTEVEEFSLKVFEYDERMQPSITGTPLSKIEKMVAVLQTPRRNSRSKCRKMTLKGNVLNFVECAHPEARVEVSLSMQTFIDHGDGIYPTSIPLLDEYLTQDLSRLTEIYIPSRVDPRWKNLLSGIRLKRVLVASATELYNVPLNTDVVEIWPDYLYYIDRSSVFDTHKWLDGAKEVHLRCAWEYIEEDSGDIAGVTLNTLLTSLARFLDRFPGERIYLDKWMGHFAKVDTDDYAVRSLSMFMRHAVDKFEARGGDASTVRSFIDHIESEL